MPASSRHLSPRSKMLVLQHSSVAFLPLTLYPSVSRHLHPLTTSIFPIYHLASTRSPVSNFTNNSLIFTPTAPRLPRACTRAVKAVDFSPPSNGKGKSFFLSLSFPPLLPHFGAQLLPMILREQLSLPDLPTSSGRTAPSTNGRLAKTFGRGLLLMKRLTALSGKIRHNLCQFQRQIDLCRRHAEPPFFMKIIVSRTFQTWFPGTVGLFFLACDCKRSFRFARSGDSFRRTSFRSVSQRSRQMEKLSKLS